MSFVPSAYNRINQPSIQFNNPVSESSIDALGAAINGLLDILTPVGSIIESMLTEAQYHSQLGISTTWVLADGRNVAGSLYNSVTGNANIPDLRGVFRRGKNNGRADGNQNPAGEVDPGTLQGSANLSHTHPLVDPGHTHSIASYLAGSTTLLANFNTVVRGPINVSTLESTVTNSNNVGLSVSASGTSESRPTNVTTNVFIRIN